LWVFAHTGIFKFPVVTENGFFRCGSEATWLPVLSEMVSFVNRLYKKLVMTVKKQICVIVWFYGG
jgi:hypothetical protein